MRTKPFSSALAHLRDIIATDAYPIGSRLPPITDLAKQASVSLVTMWKAMSALRFQGIVRSAGRKGTVVIGKAARTPAPGAVDAAHSNLLWQKIASRLESDLLSGALGRTGVLPSVKQLRVHYGINHRTMQKALRSLSEARVLVPQGRTYALSARPFAALSGEVLIFIYGERDELSLKHLDAGLLRALESLCRQSSLRPTFVRYNAVGQTVSYVNFRTGRPWTGPSGTLLGCLWIVLFDGEVVKGCCRRLLDLGCPVAVLDDTGKKEYPVFFRNHQRTKFFVGVPQGGAGESVGRQLIALGHRRVAYISTHFAQSWSQGNFHGLTRAYDAIDGKGTVRSFVVDAPGTGIRFSEKHNYSDLVRRIPRTAALPAGVSRGHLQHHFARTLEPFAEHSAYLWRIACDMEPLMRRAVRDRAITAWVCGDDNEALAALDFLKRKGIEVPQYISVAGFNNSLDALKNNLTSYGDHYEAIIQAMINYVVRPQVLGAARRKKVVMIEGILVERGTTGPARN